MRTKKHDGLGNRVWFVFVHDVKGGRATSPACRRRTRQERRDVSWRGDRVLAHRRTVGEEILELVVAQEVL